MPCSIFLGTEAVLSGDRARSRALPQVDVTTHFVIQKTKYIFKKMHHNIYIYIKYPQDAH